jgi:hypothetical protein
MEPPALMLHASALVAVAATAREHDEDAPELLRRAIAGALAGAGGSTSDQEADHARLRDRLTRASTPAAPDPSTPAMIEAYVRRHAARDARAHYNLACYVAQLAGYQEPASSRPAGEPVAAAGIEPVAIDSGELPSWEGDRDRQTMVREALVLVEQLSVHAGTPAGVACGERLRALAERAPVLGEDRFHAELAAALAGLRDPCTSYVLPRHHRDRVATLPLRLAEVHDDGAWKYVVTHVDGHVGDEDLVAGVELVRWDGVEIGVAVAESAERHAAATRDARRARALASMTCRVVGSLLPPPSSPVRIAYRSRAGRVEATELSWKVVEVTPPASPDGDLLHAVSRDEFVEAGRWRRPRACCS